MSSTLTNRGLPALEAASNSEPAEFGLEVYRAMRGIEVTVTAELGRRVISVGELLRLQVDDVLVFARPTGENVDLYARDVLIGNAEILGTNEKLAVRIAELLDKPEGFSSRASEPKQSSRSSEAGHVRSDES